MHNQNLSQYDRLNTDPNKVFSYSGKIKKHILIFYRYRTNVLITIATDSNLCITCYHDNESTKTNSLQPNFKCKICNNNAKKQQKERYFALRELTIDYIMNILVLE